MKDYHCCATCNNFVIQKGARTRYICSRLKIETSPDWKFKCWDARKDIKEKIER